MIHENKRNYNQESLYQLIGFRGKMYFWNRT